MAGSQTRCVDHTARVAHGAPAFAVTINGTRTMFSIDDDAFDCWAAAECDELGDELSDPSDGCAGSDLSDLVYEALSACVLVGDPSIELNVHNDGDGYLVRLNNVAGSQQWVGLTRGWQEPLWPSNESSPRKRARRYLQEVCDIANALLDDLLVTPA